MKKFVFSLNRVMDWRDTQARVAESKLQKLHAELASIEARSTLLLKERSRSDLELLAAPSATGAELRAISAFRRFSVIEHTRLEALRTDFTRRIAAQLQVVVAKRRDVRLLERLKEQRFAAWQTDFNREIDAQAEESHLAKWNSRR
jgi:hypothetical protein